MSIVTLFNVAALIDFVFMILSLRSQTKRSYVLASCCFFAAFITVTYIKSATLTEYLPMSIMSSLYFIGIDLLLISLSAYVLYYTNQKSLTGSALLDNFIKLYVAVDIMIFLINPIKEIAISYTFNEEGMSLWRYSPKFLCQCHIALAYVLILLVFYTLLRKTLKVPRIYRVKFHAIIYGVLLIVGTNGVFYFFQNRGYYDFSVLFYTVILAYLYLFDFHFIQRATQNTARHMMLEEMTNPTILFDYENRVLIHNSSVKDIVEKEIDHDLTLEEFIKLAGFEKDQFDLDTQKSFYLYKTIYGSKKVYRCDFKPLQDSVTGEALGHLFIFTDSSMDVDLLTDFASRTRYYKWAADEKDRVYVFPTLVIVYDINELSLINSKYGQDMGDQALRLLASSIRGAMPNDTYFARLNDAILLTISPRIGNAQIDGYIDDIKERIYASSELSFNFDFAYGSCQINNADEKITTSVETALSALYLKKMLDNKSIHASLLNSLAQVQQESDSSTEEHVKRTNQLGMKLGKRLGFSERQLSELALLCLMHDIGKLGVPLDILNKPGKLTDTEWDILKSHTEKGYRIAKASKELSIIADYILYHHERWDGKGYPDGLKAEAIPLLSRVIAVVDAYDAMTNDRAYRKKICPCQALAEIKKNAGTQFDPVIATEFIKMIEEETGIAPEETDTNFVKPIITRDSRSGDISDLENENLHLLHFSRYILDEKDYIISVDNNFEELTGYNRSDVMEMHLNQLDLIPAEDQEAYTALASNIVSSDGYAYIEHRIRRKDSSMINVFCLGRRFFDSAVSQMRNAIFITDISQAKTLQKLVDQGLVSMKRSLTAYEGLARKDSLTGILNNNAFGNDAQEKLYEEEKLQLLLMIDLDNFKAYNDAYGHPEGDELLKSFSKRLQELVGEKGIFGRMGGDEFAVLISLDKDTDSARVEERVSEITTELCESAKTFSPSLSVSIGAKINDASNTSFSALYRGADIALYEAKKSGKGHYILKS